jgi:DNA polymerase III delta subunit
MFVAIIGGAGSDRKNKAKDVLAKMFPKTAFQFALIESLPSEDALLGYAYQSEGFFSDKQIVLIKDCADEIVDTFSKKTLEILAHSETPFIFLDEKITKATETTLKDCDATITSLATPEKKSSFNKNDVFAICDAFSAKNKFRVWHEFSKLVAKNEGPEAIVGILFSRIRTMLRDRRYTPYTKNELERLSASLALLLPKEREKGSDTLLALERWILAMPE